VLCCLCETPLLALDMSHQTKGYLAIFGNFGISEVKYHSVEAPYARPVG
jgi:hypothetical protein